MWQEGLKSRDLGGVSQPKTAFEMLLSSLAKNFSPSVSLEVRGLSDISLNIRALTTLMNKKQTQEDVQDNS